LFAPEGSSKESGDQVRHQPKSRYLESAPAAADKSSNGSKGSSSHTINSQQPECSPEAEHGPNMDEESESGTALWHSPSFP